MDFRHRFFIRAELALPGGTTDERSRFSNSLTPSCTTEKERSSIKTISNAMLKDHVIHWADIDNRPMDFDLSSLPPELLTLTDAEIKNDKDAFYGQSMKPNLNSNSATP